VYVCVCCCRKVGSEWALEMAKYNLAHNYLVVGTTDELEEFVAVLEAGLPRFFSGALEFFVTGLQSILRFCFAGLLVIHERSSVDNQTRMFYRPDTLAVTQPTVLTVSEH